MSADGTAENSLSEDEVALSAARVAETIQASPEAAQQQSCTETLLRLQQSDYGTVAAK